MKIRTAIFTLLIFFVASGSILAAESGGVILAIPQATPEKRLDAAAVAALIEELKDGLPDLIESEDSVNAIGERWDEHKGLAGKTKPEILQLLLGDVKAVTKDKDTLDNIWKNWTDVDEDGDQPAVAAPKPVPPPAQKPAPPPAKPAEQSSCRPQGGSASTLPPQVMFGTGTVRCYDEKRGFGYILPDAGGQDIFFSRTSINMVGVRTLQEGLKVQFQIQIGRNGQLIAVNVQAV